MSSKDRTIPGAGLLLLGLAGLAQGVVAADLPADSHSDASASDPMGTIVVTASRTRESIDQVAQSVSVIKSTEIQETSAQELDEALRLVPGIDLLGYPGESQHPTSDSLGMRGLGGGAQGISRALVLLDGVPLNDGFFGNIQWARVDLDDIDQVEVVRGGGSPLWGNYAEGGVIQILSKEPTPGVTHVDAGLGSYFTYRTAADTAVAVAAGNVVQAAVSLTGTDGAQEVPTYERTPFNVPTSFHAVNAKLRDRIDLGGEDDLDVALTYHENHQRLETLLDDNFQRMTTLTAGSTHHLGAAASIAFNAFYTNSDFTTNNSTYYTASSDTLASTTQALNEIHHLGYNDVGAALTWQQDDGGSLRTMAGVDARHIAASDRTEHFIDPSFNPADYFTRSQGAQTFYGAFARVAWTPLARLDLSLSGRWQSLRDRDGVDGSLGGAGAVADQTYTTFVPRLDLRYALDAGWALRAAAYQSFRAPNIGDEFYTYAAGGFVMVPSTGLQPERLHGGEVGLDSKRGATRTQLSLYRTRINNYIITEPATNPVYSPAGWYVVENVNIASVLAQGVELENEASWGAGYFTRVAYTLASSVVKDNPLDPASVGQQVVDVARNRFSADITYKSPGGWRASTQVYWVDRTAWASPDHTSPGYPGALSADPHLLVDASAAHQLTGHLELYAQVQNLFNRHAVVTSYSAPSPQDYGTPLTLFAGVRGTL
jgi:outer membrane cobalamin receptor